MTDLFEGYFEELAESAAWDEVFEAAERPRPGYTALHDALRFLGGNDLALRRENLDRAFRTAGITFGLAGQERPWPLDLVPRLLDAAQWHLIERGVAQRVRALEAFLADVYGAGGVFEDGVVPRRLVLSSPNYHRVAHGFEPPQGVRVHVAGIDLIRDEDGHFRVLEDNVRVPSGVSYVLENRHAMTKVFPEVFDTHRVRPVADYAVRLLAALSATAPDGIDNPTVVLLSPGIYNSAYFEHTLLARQMGVELVEGRDLVVRHQQVFMRTTAAERPVHVIYRRVDDDWLDPLHFRVESRLGCPGLLNVARAGRVTIANAVGNGVADDKLIHTYIPDLIRYYLGEQPLLANVDSYRLEDPDQRAFVLDNLDTLVLKPVDGSGGKGIVIGPRASDAELATLRCHVERNPRGWIAQRVIALSTSPTLVEGRLAPRHVDLRPFAINDGERIRVLPGGLTRVALPHGGLIVNSSQGGGSKDTWVIAGDEAARDTVSLWDEPDGRARPADQAGHGMLSRVAEALFWMGRYTERAEHTARILDVHLQRLMEDPWLDADQANRSLLGVMGLPRPPGDLSSWGVMEALGYDRDSRSSVTGALSAARENARGARDVLSSEVWECLNATWLELPDRQTAAERVGPHLFLRHVRQRAAMLVGLIDATASRDDGRRFLELGWHLERVDMTARLLSACVADPSATSSWVGVLRSCGAHEAFLRTYRHAADGRSVAEFLLLDRHFPRSVFSSLRAADVLLAEMDLAGGPSRSGVRDPARCTIGQARDQIEYRRITDVGADVADLLTELQQSCASASDQIRERFFASPDALTWASGPAA